MTQPTEQPAAGIRPVTYYEAWCCAPEPHRIDLGDYSAYGQREAVESSLAATDAVVRMPDGRIFCTQHIPDEVCWHNRPPYGNGNHEREPGDAEPLCMHCDAVLPVLTPERVA